MKKDLNSRKFTRGETRKTPVDLWQYMRSSRAKVHAGPCKSLTLRWWMTLNIIKSPTNPWSVWQRSLGANEDFEEPSHTTWWRRRWWERVRDGSLEVTSLLHAYFLFTHTAKYLWPAIRQPQFKVEALALAGTEMHYFHLGKNNIHVFWFDYKNSTMEIKKTGPKKYKVPKVLHKSF